jgi:hypothetical protein
MRSTNCRLFSVHFPDYKWVFSEWAIARGNRAHTSNGHVIRDIILNPNGFAMHCKCTHFKGYSFPVCEVHEALVVQFVF